MADARQEPGSLLIERELEPKSTEEIDAAVEAVKAQAMPWLEKGWRVLRVLTVTLLDTKPAEPARVRVDITLHPTKGLQPILGEVSRG